MGILKTIQKMLDNAPEGWETIGRNWKYACSFCTDILKVIRNTDNGEKGLWCPRCKQRYNFERETNKA